MKLSELILLVLRMILAGAWMFGGVVFAIWYFAGAVGPYEYLAPFKMVAALVAVLVGASIGMLVGLTDNLMRRAFRTLSPSNVWRAIRRTRGWALFFGLAFMAIGLAVSLFIVVTNWSYVARFGGWRDYYFGSVVALFPAMLGVAFLLLAIRVGRCRRP